MIPRLRLVCLFLLLVISAAPGRAAPAPVLIGIDVEFGLPDSLSAAAIAHGAGIAIDEINAGGGVLGRPLALVERANGSLPARRTVDPGEFAAMPDLVAVLCGRFSPTVLDNLPLLDPWSAADCIVDHGQSPNRVFRLSPRDSRAPEAMLVHLDGRGMRKIGMLNRGSARGRSTRHEALPPGDRFIARYAADGVIEPLR